MQIIVINLKDCHEKKERMRALLSRMDCPFEFLEATKGCELDTRDITPNPLWFDPWSHRHITQGEVGCALSHFRAWQKILSDGLDSAIILEDDVETITEGFVGDCERISVDYDLIFLGRKNMEADVIEARHPTSEHLVIPNFSYWACAYMVSRAGATKLTANFELFSRNVIPVDEYLPYMYGATPLNATSFRNIHSAFGSMQRDLTAFAFEQNLLRPVGGAFPNSSTFHSVPYSSCSDLCCVSVATEANDCCLRYIRSCEQYGARPFVCGMEGPWQGGDMARGPGGGQKVNLLRDHLASMTENCLLLFTDNYDVVMNDHVRVLVEKYRRYFDGKIVFATETSCWPDATLAGRYPQAPAAAVTRYLNSGGFIGYRDDLEELLQTPIQHAQDDQLYYTIKFLNDNPEGKIVLDYDCSLFLCLNGITPDIQIHKAKSCLYYRGERPAVVHGNGPESVKIFLNNIVTNYCLDYNSMYGRRPCVSTSTAGRPLLCILHETFPGNFDAFAEGVLAQTFGKATRLLVLFETDDFRTTWDCPQVSERFQSVACIRASSRVWEQIVQWVESEPCDYIFYHETRACLTNAHCLESLMAEDKKAIAPLLVEANTFYSNFWGDVASNGFYKRSSNYFDILSRRERGCWNVPYIAHTMLLHRSLLMANYFTRRGQAYRDADMLFCSNLRQDFCFMYLLNSEEWGFLLPNLSLKSISPLQDSWERKYLYPHGIQNNWYHEHLGNDIHKLYMFSETFCKELIDIADAAEKWSSGGDSHYDERIAAYEHHPTQDVQLHQLGLEDMWRNVLERYIAPFVSGEFNYKTKGFDLAFVVKYSMDGQRELQPHHDASSYTVNLCLNRDFQGGGCRFLRQAQDVRNEDPGSLILHPGRVTHYHAGLPITKGKRYLLVTFVK